MKITMGCYQAVSVIHGGPRVQILQTRLELEKLGADVSLFDPWRPFSRQDCDLFHVFSANIGTFHMVRNIRALNVPMAASPIFFTRRAPWFIRTSLAGEHMAKRIHKGFWTDYGCTEQVCLWSQAVLPNTREEARLVQNGLGIPASKITVIPNGVEARFESGDPSLFRKKFGLDKFILNVGHIGPERKNVLGLIRALKTVNHPAVIIGKVVGREGEQCVKEASENKNILIIPGLDNESEMLASAYAACDVFVLPSLFETPGIAALEAALAGAKIVITDRGGTQDYFGSMARYVNPYSIESIREGILSALTMNRSDVLQQHVKKEYLWSAVAEKTLAVYEGILRQ